MGGYCEARDTTSSYHALDIRHLQRRGLLKPGRRFNCQWSRNGQMAPRIRVRTEPERIWLSYKHSRHDQSWQPEEYPVSVEWTPCNFGGKRAWFLCPMRGCGRRVAILYSTGILACRHCQQLTYESQLEQPYERPLRRAKNIRERLGGSGSLVEPFPSKPRGMHWRTYERLRLEAADAESHWLAWLAELGLQTVNRDPR